MRKVFLTESGALNARFMVALALWAAGALIFSLAATAKSRPITGIVSPSKFSTAQAATRTPIYQTGGFTFGQTKQLLPAPLPVGQFQNVEPEIKIDLFGNIYVSAIQGVPDGVDLWKSADKGETFTFLGQPDGVQCPTPPICVDQVGVGGADNSKHRCQQWRPSLHLEFVVRQPFRLGLDQRRVCALDPEPRGIEHSVGRSPMDRGLRAANCLSHLSPTSAPRRECDQRYLRAKIDRRRQDLRPAGGDVPDR